MFVYNLTNLPRLSIFSPNFFTTFHTQFELLHPTIIGIFRCVCTSHWPYGYPPFTLRSWQRTHWNPWCNSRCLCHHCTRSRLPRATKIIKCASFNHIQLFLLTNQHCVHQIWHLHPSRHCHCRPNVNEFTSLILCNSRICHLQLAQGKKKCYYNWHPTDQFLPFVIEVFCCLHKHVDLSLHDCANAIWSLKGLEG
jgi:hypothetical protein